MKREHTGIQRRPGAVLTLEIMVISYGVMIKFLAWDLPVFLNIDVEIIQSFLFLSVLIVALEVVSFTRMISNLCYCVQAATFLPSVDTETFIPFRSSTRSFALGP